MDRKEILKILTLKVKELTPIITRDIKGGDLKNAFFISNNSHVGNTICLNSFEELRLLNSLSNLIMDYKVFSIKFSDSYISNETIELLHKIAKNPEKEADLLEDFLNILLKPNTEWFVMSILENIDISNEQPFNILDSTLKLIDAKDFPFNTLPNLEQSKMYSVFKDYIGKSCIFTNVQAGDNNKAWELALENFNISLNLLKLYGSNLKPALSGTLLSGFQKAVMYHISTKSFSSKSSLVGTLPNSNKATLNKKVYTSLCNEGIDELLKSSSITQVVKESLYWYGLGLEEKHPSAKVLNFVTILEATLKTKSERTELNKCISERGAILLGGDLKTRISMREELKQIYTIRSRIVHTGVLEGDKNISNLSGTYARAVLIKLINSNSKFKGNFDSFINYLDIQKLT